MEIQFDAEKLQEAIVKEITTTTFGGCIASAVEKQLHQRDNYGHGDTVIERAAKEQVSKVVSHVIANELQNKRSDIKRLVREALTDDVYSEMVSTVVKIMTGRIKVDY